MRVRERTKKVTTTYDIQWKLIPFLVFGIQLRVRKNRKSIKKSLKQSAALDGPISERALQSIEKKSAIEWLLPKSRGEKFNLKTKKIFISVYLYIGIIMDQLIYSFIIFRIFSLSVHFFFCIFTGSFPWCKGVKEIDCVVAKKKSKRQQKQKKDDHWLKEKLWISFNWFNKI